MASELLDHVHILAVQYRWTEPDVLRLPRRRRLAYLERISDMLEKQKAKTPSTPRRR